MFDLYVGDNYNSTLLLRWCGWGHPSTPFVSSNDSLYVYFHTDSSISYGGFEMKAYINETAHGRQFFHTHFNREKKLIA